MHKQCGKEKKCPNLNDVVMGWRCLTVLLRGTTNSREKWREDTTWDAQALTYDTSMMAQNFGRISLHISKLFYKGGTPLFIREDVCKMCSHKALKFRPWLPKAQRYMSRNILH